MNRFNKILIAVFSMALLMVACNDDNSGNTGKENEKEDPYLKYESDTDFWFSEKKGDTTIAVIDVNRAYYATVAEGGEWCTVSNVSVNYFVINYEENKKAENRTTKITLSMDGVDDIELVVTQRGPHPTMVIDSALFSEVVAPYMGVDTTVSIITTNGDYKVEVETGKEWCSPVNLTDAGFKLNIAQNNEIEGREARVAVVLAYRDSTARFEFVVKQAPTPILLTTPQDEETIRLANDFPYNCSWQRTGGITSYSIAISASAEFPDDATKVIAAGDVDKYVLALTDISDPLYSTNAYQVALYWKVMPTDPSINISTETKKFHVLRKLIRSYPVTLSGANSWSGVSTDDEGYQRWGINAGQSSRRTWVETTVLEEPLPGPAVALTYEYKTTNRSSAYQYDYYDIYHYLGGYDGNWVIDCPVTRGEFTDEWLRVRVPLTANRAWGTEGNRNKATLFIRPPVVTSNGNNISGMFHHVRNIEFEVYE
jgi:hypothetical protein